ncbi:hypothetical protein [Azorhizobium caulinodans]|uniref:hypothetical protein n=1 Tax=Azorhizobium caulinodans TaxID=7 RepID=UPI002FBD5B0F
MDRLVADIVSTPVRMAFVEGLSRVAIREAGGACRRPAGVAVPARGRTDTPAERRRA